MRIWNVSILRWMGGSSTRWVWRKQNMRRWDWHSFLIAFSPFSFSLDVCTETLQVPKKVRVPTGRPPGRPKAKTTEGLGRYSPHYQLSSKDKIKYYCKFLFSLIMICLQNTTFAQAKKAWVDAEAKTGANWETKGPAKEDQGRVKINRDSIWQVEKSTITWIYFLLFDTFADIDHLGWGWSLDLSWRWKTI